MKKLLSKVAITLVLLMTPAHASCGASHHGGTTTIINLASSVLNRVEAYADRQLQYELESTVDPRLKKEALLFWRTIYDLLNTAENYLLAALDADGLGDDKAARQALRCYREIITHVDEYITARGLSIKDIVHGVILLLPEDEVNTCKY